MAAPERLLESVKRIHSTGPRSRTPVHHQCSDHEINVDEELDKLQPSQRLLDYYREKISKFQKENQEMQSLIEKYQGVSKPTLQADERKQMVRELVELRSALSDVNVFLHAERQQVLKLHSEKEQLQLDALEAEKKVALLLTLSGLTEGELMVFLRDPQRVNLIKQKLPPHLRKLQRRLDKEMPKLEMSENEFMLNSRVKSLEKQIKEVETNWIEEKNTLLQERTLTASENKAQREKEEAHIKLLSSRLEESQLHLSAAMKQTLKRNAEIQELEKGFLAERDHLLSVLATVQDNLPLVTQVEAIQRSGSYTDLSKPKSTCELKDLRRENEHLKHKLQESEEFRTLYESQCLKLEQTMCKLREQKESFEQMYKERNKRLIQQIEQLEQENKKVEERRKGNLRGFHSDIQLLKNDMKTIVAQMYKITSSLYRDNHTHIDIESLNEMQAVSALVRAVQMALGDSKRKLLRVESEDMGNEQL